MLKNIANLIKVKTIVTFVVLAVWAYMDITGEINSDAVNNITITVVAFYFGTQIEKNVNSKE